MPDFTKPWEIAVYAIVRDRTGRVLLLRRSRKNKNFAGTWEFPGGKVDTGESVDVTLIRETREEAGLEIALTGLAGATESEMPNVRVVLLFFHVTWLSGEVRIDDAHDESRWAQPNTLAEIELRPQVAAFLRERPLR